VNLQTFEHTDEVGAVLGVISVVERGFMTIADSGEAVVLYEEARLKLARFLAGDLLADALAGLKWSPPYASLPQAETAEVYNLAIDTAIKRVKGEA